MHTMAIDWGDAPTWIGAITTTLAFGAALAVVVIELRRDKRAAEDRARSEQASLCAAWPDRRSNGEPIVTFRNGSNLPVYDLQLWLVNDDGEALNLTEAKPVQPPGDTWYEYPGEVIGYTAEGFLDVDHRDIWFPECRFTDAAGRTWVRDANGALDRAPTSHLGAVRGP